MNRFVRTACFAILCCLVVSPCWAQSFKKLPPDGIDIGQAERTKLSQRVDSLKTQLSAAVHGDKDQALWRTNVEVLIRAVDTALAQDLFFNKKSPANARVLLDEAERRIKLAGGGSRTLDLLMPKESASDKPVLFVGGFVSAIDDSVQPYGVVLPVGYDPKQSYRLDVWLHGRGDTKMEIAFLHERMTKVGQYAPKDTIVLHPFGRHCNAFKFAGETDVYEAIQHVSSLLKVDSDRIAIRGFSMGGAGCWHLAAHNPTQWFAANPGAGFVDTIKYQGWEGKMPFQLGDARTKLMRLYDVLPWTANLKNTKLIAYSGEVDKQRQAADRVVEAIKKHGIKHQYVIGKDMGHKIDPPSRDKIDAQIAAWAKAPIESPRREIDFTTYTVRYAKADWLTIDGLKEQWTSGHASAKITDNNTLRITTEGVTHLKLDFSDSGWPGKKEVGLTINGERFYITDTGDAAGLQCQLALGDQWEQIVGDEKEIRKRPGMQGPIDDAFRERFLFVMPSRPAANGVVERWVKREIAYAQSRWLRLMRGEIRSVKDVDLSDEQIKNCNLICFGDFMGNRYLNKVAGGLPVVWTRDKLEFSGKSFDPATHAPVFCYPNPKNPSKYLVVNSGMTYREFSNVSNSRQIAMLPDWAVLKVDDEFDDSIFAGQIAAEGFFDEQWQVK